MPPFNEIAALVTNEAFLGRLAVAVTEHCRYTLEREKRESESDARYAWEQTHARRLLADICIDRDRARIARLCLLPIAWGEGEGAFDPHDDDKLQARVQDRFLMFFQSTPPA